MTTVKTLADFKRLPVGTKLKLHSASEGFGGTPHRFLGVTREIEHKQTNAIRFTGGSWLYYPTADEFSVQGDIVEITDKSAPGFYLAYQIIT